MTQMSAPFGLTWGATREEIQALNVELVAGESGPNGAAYVAKGVPKPVVDVDSIFLFFTDGGKLWRIVAAFKSVQNDPYGLATQTRYAELKDALSKRYGLGQEGKLVQAAYAAEHFVLGLSSGENQIFCNFGNAEIFVQLAIRAGAIGESFCMLFYESKLLKAEFSAEQRRRELDAL
jgi:hypothetical protein